MNLNDFRCIDSNIDVIKYINFREMVKKNMNNPDWLGDFSKEDLIYLLNNGAKIWVYYSNDEPVCSMMSIPSSNKSVNKMGLKLDYKKAIDYGPMFVNPKFVGNKLQYKMLQEIDKYSKNKGYSYAITTIHPDNIYSINNVVKDGFEFSSQREFSRGLRNIYFKKLT